jgi:hypothetical protein
MPAVIPGLVETRKALRQFAPDLLKESDREMKQVLQVIVREAKSFVPSESPLRNLAGQMFCHSTAPPSCPAFAQRWGAALNPTMVSSRFIQSLTLPRQVQYWKPLAERIRKASKANPITLTLALNSSMLSKSNLTNARHTANTRGA